MGIGRDIGPLLAIPSRLRAVAAKALLQWVVHGKRGQGFEGRRQRASCLEKQCRRQTQACLLESESGCGRQGNEDQEDGPPEHRTAANALCPVGGRGVSCESER